MRQDATGPVSPRHRGPVRVYRLGQEPGDDLSESTTPEERIAMVGELSARLWEISGQPFPAYTRATMPVVVIRRR